MKNNRLSQIKDRFSRIGVAQKSARDKRPLTQEGPLISIVMPAYNNEAFVERAVRSCLSQTYEKIELVCVDDASSDGTLDKLSELANADDPSSSRVKVIALEANSGTHNARLAGLGAATGELVMFLDADDELARNACSVVAAEYLREPVDILHFAARVCRDGRVEAQRALDVADWATPVKGALQGREILTRSFVDLDYSFSIWGKAYRAELAHRAFDALGSLRSDFGEDALEYFAIAYFAETYRGIPNRRLYVYHLGDGLSANTEMTADEFDRTLRGVQSIAGMREFLENQGEAACDELMGVYEAHRAGQLSATLTSLMSDVRERDKREALRRVLALWPQDEVMDGMCALGTPALELLRECLGGDLALSERQAYKQGVADGAASAREEYQASSSYRLGRAATALPRVLRSLFLK